MTGHDLARAWKDPDRRDDVNSVDHPAGEITLDVFGGGRAGVATTEYVLTLGCCGGITSDTCTCVQTICSTGMGWTASWCC